MRLTIPHHYDFGAERELVGDDLLRASAWDALRMRTDGPFALASSREEWERAAESQPELTARAAAIDGLLRERGAQRVASYGAGVAMLELLLHRASPERELTVTDYAPESVERLAEMFPEAHVTRHDLLADPPLDADVHLFHRIDTEFDNRQWRGVLKRFESEEVLVVAAGLVGLRGAAFELMRRARHPFGSTRAGWLRTGPTFEALWRGTHDARPLRLHDLDGWELRPR